MFTGESNTAVTVSAHAAGELTISTHATFVDFDGEVLHAEFTGR